MVEKSIFEADHKAIVIIASPGIPGPRYLTSVFSDAGRVVEFADRYGFDTVVDLRDHEATPDAVNKFFSQQSLACIEHGM